MKRKYPLAVSWVLLATFGIALFFLIVASPPHNENDYLFLFMALNILLLIGLSLMLHAENREEERSLFLRVFCLVDWALAVLMAAWAMWNHASLFAQKP